MTTARTSVGAREPARRGQDLLLHRQVQGVHRRTVQAQGGHPALELHAGELTLDDNVSGHGALLRRDSSWARSSLATRPRRHGNGPGCAPRGYPWRVHGAVEGLGGAIGDGVASVTPLSLAAEQLPDAWPGTWNPLGVTLDADGANVAVWSEGAHAVDLCLFDEDGRERRVALSETTFHIFHGYVPGMKAGDRYGFRVHGPWDPWRGDRWNSAKLLMDPYARAIEGEYVAAPGHPRARGPRRHRPRRPRLRALRAPVRGRGRRRASTGAATPGRTPRGPRP